MEVLLGAPKRPLPVKSENSRHRLIPDGIPTVEPRPPLMEIRVHAEEREYPGPGVRSGRLWHERQQVIYFTQLSLRRTAESLCPRWAHSGLEVCQKLVFLFLKQTFELVETFQQSGWILMRTSNAK